MIIHCYILFVHFLPSILITESSMAGIIKKKKSAYGKRKGEKLKTYDTYMAAMAARAEAAVDVDLPAVVVAAAVFEVPPRSC